MAYWLVKSEPSTWSWEQQQAAGVTHWDGVRNYLAANYLKAMKIGNQALFYHSGEARCIVGIVEVVREYYPDPTDPTGRFGMVDLKAVCALPKPVSLDAIKADGRFHHIALVRQSRLSVMPIDDIAWRNLTAMGGLTR